jgi:class 3 adenylate cyclase/tetratricopeptide (TPR) repeat protein
MRCQSCRFDNQPEMSFCGACGSRLGEGSLRAGRRNVTLLFADLVGFSTLAERSDPEDLHHLIRDVFGELVDRVREHGGWVEKFIGDAILAVFGAPVAHEDDPRRAAETALAMLDALSARSEAAGGGLQLRIGINSGLVIAGPRGDGGATGVLGDAVNTAARLQEAAAPGEVLVAAGTWRRIREDFDTEPIGVLTVKGKAEQVTAYRLGRRRQRRVRAGAPLIGRELELAGLESLWCQARQGVPQTVVVAGEPGVGKSRLIGALARRSGVLDVRVTCDGRRPFGACAELLAGVLGGRPESPTALREALRALGADERDSWLLLPVFGWPTPEARAPDLVRTFSGFARALEAAARRRPLLAVLDDVHEADGSSTELIRYLLSERRDGPMMLVLGARPAFDVGGGEHTMLRLEPLPGPSAVALACRLLDAERLAQAVEVLVVERAGGHPFFIEELVTALREHGSLSVVDGVATLTGAAVSVPDTVQDAIVARIDALPARERALLQRAAVIGPLFSVPLLVEIAGEPEAEVMLDRLADAQLVAWREGPRWEFKHALIREATYETLLRRERRALHAQVADRLEAEAGDDPEALADLADHCARADRCDAARDYAVAAGDAARERLGFVDAARRYTDALERWDDGGAGGRTDVLWKLAECAYLAGDYPAALSAAAEAEALWNRAGDLERAGTALALRGRVLGVTGDREEAARLLDDAIDLLARFGSSPGLVDAHVAASTLRFYGGDDEEAAAIAAAGLAAAEGFDVPGARSQLMTTLGVCEVARGDLGGIERLTDALALARSACDAEALGRAYVNLSAVLWDVGRLHEAVETAAEGRLEMSRIGARGYESFLVSNLAGCMLHAGRIDEAAQLADRILRERREVVGVQGIIAAGLTRIAAHVRRGEEEAARSLVGQLLPDARRLGGAEILAPLLELQAELEWIAGDEPTARVCIREAAAVASGSSPAQLMRVLVTAARVLPPGESAALLAAVAAVPSTPLADARRAEAEGLITGDPGPSRVAADRYREIGAPYAEARCRLDCGERARAAELVARHDLHALSSLLEVDRPARERLSRAT